MFLIGIRAPRLLLGVYGREEAFKVFNGDSEKDETNEGSIEEKKREDRLLHCPT